MSGQGHGWWFRKCWCYQVLRVGKLTLQPLKGYRHLKIAKKPPHPNGGKTLGAGVPPPQILGQVPSPPLPHPAPDTALGQPPTPPVDERLAEAAGGRAACSLIVGSGNLPPGCLFCVMLHLSSCNTWIPEPILSCK